MDYASTCSKANDEEVLRLNSIKLCKSFENNRADKETCYRILPILIK